MKNNFINNLNILVIDDEELIREKIETIFLKLFAKVFVAETGLAGLKIIRDENIDVVISDINMPMLDGLTLLEETNKFKDDIDFILISSFCEPEYLLKAIKNSAVNYLTKPINIAELIKCVNSIGEIKHKKIVLENREKENLEYMNTLNQIAIVSKTDLKGCITYVNDIFCDISGYSRDELIGKPHNIVRHPDMPSAAFKDLWTTIKGNKIWKGKVKNLDKNGDSYFVNTTVYPILDDISGEISEYMSVRFLITNEELEKREFKKNVMKSIADNKRQNISARLKIDELKSKIKEIEHLIPLKEKNQKLISQIAYYEDEIKRLNTEYLESRKALKEESQSFYNKYKTEQKQNEMNTKRILSLTNELNSRQEEYTKINEQLAEQSKIIKNLKDVIEYRESQIEGLKLK